ncbi:MAG: cobyrinate a,c-diamide synthase [Pseudomonadota bacterium]
MSSPGRGIILAAPSSGCGKTTLTLAILHALSQAGKPVRGAKSGPDYIDPAFHAAATRRPCVNLDPWAMGEARLKALCAGPELLVIEGAMGLFDGAGLEGRGATADLSRNLGLPVVLIVDAAKVAHSVAPMMAGFATADADVTVAGIILNRVGSDRHAAMLKQALLPLGLPILGMVPRDPAFALPERHLGLVQAEEHPSLQAFLETAAMLAARHIDLEHLANLSAPLPEATEAPPNLPRLGNRIAIAHDTAFAFSYPHLLDAWHATGASLHPFSPLAGQPPPPDIDAIFLPGGYPELWAGELAAMRDVWDGVRRAAERGLPIYGECGGYMVLGETLTDAKNKTHAMAGLLELHTSFATRKRHLGYRHLQTNHPILNGTWAGHEFHYASTVSARGTPLFTAQDADGEALPPMGLSSNNVFGSFAHIIDRSPLAPPDAKA